MEGGKQEGEEDDVGERTLTTHTRKKKTRDYNERLYSALAADMLPQPHATTIAPLLPTHLRLKKSFCIAKRYW